MDIIFNEKNKSFLFTKGVNLICRVNKVEFYDYQWKFVGKSDNNPIQEDSCLDFVGINDSCAYSFFDFS